MSEERVVRSSSRLEEDPDGIGEEQATQCFQGASLCCCIPTRRMGGRRPKERKGKNGKKNANLPSLGDIVFPERQQNRDRDSWSMASVGDLGGLPIANLKPAPNQPRDDNSQEPDRPVLLSDIFLEEKKRHDDKANANVQTKDCERKEALDDSKIPPLETGRTHSVDRVSEVKGHPVVSVKENRQPGKRDLDVLIKEGAYKKGHNEGGDHMNLVMQGVPCKKEMNQGHQDMPPEELQKSRELELESILMTEEKILLEQSISLGSEGITSLQELLNQYSEEEKLLEQEELAMGAAHVREKQIMSSQWNSSSEREACRDDQICQNEAQKPTELKYLNILSTVSESHEEEEAGEQQHLQPGTEASLTSLEYSYINLLDWEDQSLVIPQDVNIPCQGTSSENNQKEVQAARSSASNIAFIKVDDHQYIPYNLYQQTTASESTILPLNATSTTNLQTLDNINSSLEDAAINAPEQKHPETQEYILLEQNNTYDQSKGKEQHSEVEDTHFGSKAADEEENQEPVVSEDLSKLPGNIRFEKEQERKLDGGDSGSEGIYDKEEPGCQDNPCIDVQQPLIVSKLTSLPLSSSEELCEKKDSTMVSNRDIHCLDESPEEQDGQCPMHTDDSSDEKETTLGPEEEWLTVPLLSEGDKEDLESKHTPEGASMPHEEQQEKEELNLDRSCEEQQRKEKEDLSPTTFSGDAVQDEGLM
ncbi:hypothetical protein E2320_009168 [Naja naja]|nr:hypothetical protein E2320_009168 [Naja naja]